MSPTEKKQPSEEARIILETLQRVAKKTLERKRRLGEYAVVWKDGRPVMIGEDAPKDAGRSE
ncbi:hypothetical protein [Geothermobacter hydrogeniphilus]|uniref:Uncharacterized protein n=1 Tax=Geothermobacter hydrogeniphilus TaxID=1969733 RepID=A0A1X0Y928_9BACT|nr:hypothetical protein [Geothermobacter hydrogeniphilus]ORJ61609.1 hypothetical protein B5V00_06115 [Geothermobacter hydrogeniphilus]